MRWAFDRLGGQARAMPEGHFLGGATTVAGGTNDGRRDAWSDLRPARETEVDSAASAGIAVAIGLGIERDVDDEAS